MKWRCEDEEKSIADRQVEEPIITWYSQYRGNRVTHRSYPCHYARVLIAKATRNGWSLD